MFFILSTFLCLMYYLCNIFAISVLIVLLKYCESLPCKCTRICFLISHIPLPYILFMPLWCFPYLNKIIAPSATIYHIYYYINKDMYLIIIYVNFTCKAILVTEFEIKNYFMYEPLVDCATRRSPSLACAWQHQISDMD